MKKTNIYVLLWTFISRRLYMTNYCSIFQMDKNLIMMTQYFISLNYVWLLNACIIKELYMGILSQITFVLYNVKIKGKMGKFMILSFLIQVLHKVFNIYLPDQEPYNTWHQKYFKVINIHKNAIYGHQEQHFILYVHIMKFIRLTVQQLLQEKINNILILGTSIQQIYVLK